MARRRNTGRTAGRAVGAFRAGTGITSGDSGSGVFRSRDGSRPGDSGGSGTELVQLVSNSSLLSHSGINEAQKSVIR